MRYATETDRLLMTLKQEFKRQKLTYKAIAIKIGLSEVSVKRIFSDKNISLERLENLCQIVQLDIVGLARLADQQRTNANQLSLEQEQQIVDDPNLILVLVCLINHWRFDEISQKYAFEEAELFRLFARLDKLKVIDLFPLNRYRLNLSTNFNWQANGPFQKFFLNNILQDYLKPSLINANNHLKFVWGMLTPESTTELKHKIHRLIEDFMKIAEIDKRVSVHSKMTSSLMVLFREDWEPREFKDKQNSNYRNTRQVSFNR